MSINELNTIVQIACISLLALLEACQRWLNSWTGVEFAAAIICYLLIASDFAERNKFISNVFLTGATGIQYLSLPFKAFFS